MMFDTLRMATDLRKAGFSEVQAYGFAEALAQSMSPPVATKADIEALRADIRENFAALRREVAGLKDGSPARDAAGNPAGTTCRANATLWRFEVKLILFNTVALLVTFGGLYVLLTSAPLAH